MSEETHQSGGGLGGEPCPAPSFAIDENVLTSNATPLRHRSEFGSIQAETCIDFVLRLSLSSIRVRCTSCNL